MIDNLQFLPPKYDYHRTLSFTEERECVICMSPVHPVVSHDYMLTPCDHIFHTPCLLQWMNFKMECPICRRQLPVP